jgi:hypothetical protein
VYTDHDPAFWLGVLVSEGKLKPEQFNPEDIAWQWHN